MIARVNWYPRWEATVDNERAETDRLHDGYVGIAPAAPVSRAELVYSVQPLDWAARVLSLIGVVGLCWLLVRQAAKFLESALVCSTAEQGRSART